MKMQNNWISSTEESFANGVMNSNSVEAANIVISCSTKVLQLCAVPQYLSRDCVLCRNSWLQCLDSCCSQWTGLTSAVGWSERRGLHRTWLNVNLIKLGPSAGNEDTMKNTGMSGSRDEQIWENIGVSIRWQGSKVLLSTQFWLCL
jgi:hypothetical protein